MYKEIKGIAKKDLLDILIKERDHHFNHPYDLSTKFWYGTAVVIIGIAGVIISSDTTNPFYCLSCFEKIFLIVSAVLIIIGYYLAARGILAHGEKHREKREIIENIINQVLFNENTEEDFKSNSNEEKNIQYIEFLFSAEPIRGGKAEYDRDLIWGIGLATSGILLSLIIFLLTASPSCA